MQELSVISPKFHNLVYPRMNLKDHTLDDNLPACRFQSQPDGHRFRQPPESCAGALETLPAELVAKILSQLDLRTLADFRCVNRRASELVDVLPEYRAIITHAPNALHGIVSIEAGRWITPSALYEKLCTPKCEQCDDFGGYLYLLTCKRVCFLCLSKDKLYLPLTRRRVSRIFGLEPQMLAKIPHMRVMPGIYSPNERKAEQSVLVDYESALCAGVTFHGSLDAMEKYVFHKEDQKVTAALKSGAIACRIPPPYLTDPYDGQSGNPLRFVAIVRVPWLNRALQEVEWGFHCIGCEKSSRPPLHYRRQFTEASFEDHLQQCGGIQNGRHQSG
ncbi:uncharacterized protein TrAtP1_004603 [Trichoderma atroviride]|uniref:F-box domain-containing protein n=1 Tax=Hypocrea atroviridis (strain ATCC 20476 / IMI 206040) TaxID=452589 RepID=G9P4H6_HYPAI|nr:uncharacterized protein TRIATDRAFT_295126 [Trichoderma atroviride IMI 206040]EHK41176.1 hypothetical protein TRIATDRAFT_295126 [Trichoderma atroviride IMI 206040]UKZ63372.1 hypothetical protein TrAtP1_004603 [Trichoderma atroviride]